MQFKWNMTPQQWENITADHNAHDPYALSRDFDFYGQCYIGHLCAEILHTGDAEAWFPFTNIYGLGVDDGYSETRVGKIPYALLDYDFTPPIDAPTFEAFKREFETRFLAAIDKYPEWQRLASQPLGCWD